MAKEKKVIIFVIIAIVEIALLMWVRGNYRETMLEGKEFEVPCNVVFKGEFYNRNYLHVNIPITEAPWQGESLPEKGQEVYVTIFKNDDDMMTVDHAQADKPDGSYIKVRVNDVADGKVQFDFPADRMYMSPEVLSHLSVVELSERVQVRKTGSKDAETRMKNQLTAILHIKDGRVAINKVLANGAPIEQTYTTVGTNVKIHYGTSAKDEDYIEEPSEASNSQNN